jgi:hypothetical protein
MVENVDTVWRDFEVDGVSASGAHKPFKKEIRDLLRPMELFYDAGGANGGLVFETQALMSANFAHPANTMAWVIADSTVALNGIYKKVGASGGGSWSRVGDLPYNFIRAIDVGAGTASAIQATSELPVGNDNLVAFIVNETNAGPPTTIQFNGADVYTIVTASGSNVAPGSLIAGMAVIGYVSNPFLRLLTDQASAAIQAAAEDAQAAAEAARDLAIEAADTAAVEGAGDVPMMPSRAFAIAATIPAARSYVQTQGYYNHGDGGGALYAKVGSEPAHSGKFQSADGAWWEIKPLFALPNIKQFGAVEGVDTAPQRIINTNALLGAWAVSPNIIAPAGTFYIDVVSSIPATARGLTGAGMGVTIFSGDPGGSVYLFPFYGTNNIILRDFAVVVPVTASRVAIGLVGVTGGRILNVRAQGWQAFRIDSTPGANPSGTILDGCHVNQWGYLAIYSSDTDNLTISNCWIDPSFDATASHTILIEGGSNVHVVNNTVYSTGSGGFGICYSSGGVASEHVVVAGNIVRATSNEAIQLVTATFGGSIRYFVVSDNICTWTGSVDIGIDIVSDYGGGSGPITDGVISGNVVFNTLRVGISLIGAPCQRVTVNNNVVRNCPRADPGEPTHAVGIGLDSCSYCTIVDNIISNSTGFMTWAAGEFNAAHHNVIGPNNADMGTVALYNVVSSTTVVHGWGGTTTPIVTAGSGTFTTVSCTLNYTRDGHSVTWSADIEIIAAGTAAGTLFIPLPFPATAYAPCNGRELNVTGVTVGGQVTAAGAQVFKYDNTSIIGNGRRVIVGGSYPV